MPKKDHKWLIVLIITIILVAVLAILLHLQSRQDVEREVAQLVREEMIKNQQNQTAAVVGTYQGELPCADCPGLLTTLTLTAKSTDADHGTFQLTEVYEERSVEPLVTSGDWLMMYGTNQDPKAEVFLLIPTLQEGENGNRQILFYKKVNDKTVRSLDAEGNEIESDLNFDLYKLN